MADPKDVITYICKQYPYKSDLSKSRLIKLVYLADWKSSVDRNRQITDIEWVFNHYGPYVADVIEYIKRDDDFEIKPTENMYGAPKEVIKLKNRDKSENLSEDEKKIINFVISSTVNRSFADFIKLVYNTYPIKAANRYAKLDLVSLARKFNEQVRPLILEPQ